MNAMDLYEFDDPASGKTTPQPTAQGVAASGSAAAATAEQPSLEEEITQVVGQLGRLWGGFRKQSVVALEQARKEVGQVVTSAKGEITKLASPPKSPERGAGAGTAEDRSTTLPLVDKGKQREITTDDEADVSPSSTPKPTFNAFFSRLQHSIPADSFSHTFQSIQKQIQPALDNATTQAQLVATQAATQAQQAAVQAQQAAAQVDIGQFRTSLQSNIQRIQERNAPLVAEYRKQGEAFIKDAQEYLKDAVKVVPPEEQGAVPGMTWDGTDVWMYPSPIGTAGWGRSADDAAPRKSSETMTYARLSRAEALLKRLKHDPEMLKLDPREDPTVKERFEKYIEEEIQGSGGLRGEEWSKEVEAASGEDDGALRTVHEKLVPSDLTDEEFWHRYFFRVHQIQDEEEKRKALLQATATEKEEDFSWEDDDEDSVTSPKATKADLPAKSTKPETTAVPHPKATNTTPTVTQAPVAQGSNLSPPKEDVAPASGPSSSNASPRESEESYDVLSPGIHSKDASSDDSDWE